MDYGFTLDNTIVVQAKLKEVDRYILWYLVSLTSFVNGLN